MGGSVKIAQLKIKLKDWESSFFKVHQRKPSKNDIASAPVAIQSLYREFWKLKKSLDAQEPSKTEDDIWSVKLNKPDKNRRPNLNNFTVDVPLSSMKLQKAYLSSSRMSQKKFSLKKSISAEIQATSPKVDEDSKVIIKEASVQSNFRPSSNFEAANEGNDDTELIEFNNVKIPKVVHIAKNKFKPSCPINALCTSLYQSNNELSQTYLRKSKVDLDWLERCNPSDSICKNTMEPFTDSEVGMHKFDVSLTNGLEETSQINEISESKTIDVATSNSGGPKNFEFNQQVEILEPAFLNAGSKRESGSTENSDISSLSEIGNTSIDESPLQVGSSDSLQSKSTSAPSENVPKLKSDVHSESFSENTYDKCSNISVKDDILHGEHRALSGFSDSAISSLDDDKSTFNSQIYSEKTKKGVSHKRKREDSSASLPTDKLCSELAKPAFKHIENKLSQGTINENYVRVNLKKKRYCRGKRHLTAEQHKRIKWKSMQKDRKNTKSKTSSTSCFKCGEIGHWARSCPKLQGDALMPLDAYKEMKEDTTPTLQDMSSKNVKDNGTTKIQETQNLQQMISEIVEECDDLLKNSKVTCTPEMPIATSKEKQTVSPLFEVQDNGTPPETPLYVKEALSLMGYSAFRPGQEEAIMRILSGLSTLLVLPTGAGKSLCYQLPAYLYSQKRQCMTLVISPLLSLMEDQVSRFPACLGAVCIHSGMTPAQKDEAKASIMNKGSQVMLISPEAVVNGTLKYMFPDLPPIAFACIDEAHCISEWSDNFRPSYLQLYKILKTDLGIQCILALTATATRQTMLGVAKNLGLDVEAGAIVGKTNLKENLALSVSSDKYRDEALIELLRGKRFQSCNSIIIYCIRREETERLAILIRTALQSEQPTANLEEATSKKKTAKKQNRKKRCLVWDAEAYHAGLSAFKRRSVQKRFMSGQLRVVVATIAFGMGLDKADVSAVIHYNMPKTFENYVQEIGRAGRDGAQAQCHVFLDHEGRDQAELQRHIYANTIDRHVIRKLLTKVFPRCRCSMLETDSRSEIESYDSPEGNTRRQRCCGHEVAFAINSTVQMLDVSEEGISTLLSYMELHPKKWIELLNPVYDTCTIHCYNGPQQLVSLGKKCKPVSLAISLKLQKGHQIATQSKLQFSVVEVSSMMNWNVGLVKKALKDLEWEQNASGNFKRSGVIVEFSDLSFHIRAPGDLAEEELDEVLNYLHHRILFRETKELSRLKRVFNAFMSVSHPNCWSCSEEVATDRSDKLKSLVQDYFDETGNEDPTDSVDITLTLDQVDPRIVSQIRNDVWQFLCTHHDHSFSGRAIARIFHGINSPCYPAEVWGKVRRSWRSHLETDFNVILKIANEEILKFKS